MFSTKLHAIKALRDAARLDRIEIVKDDLSGRLYLSGGTSLTLHLAKALVEDIMHLGVLSYLEDQLRLQQALTVDKGDNK